MSTRSCIEMTIGAGQGIAAEASRVSRGVGEDPKAELDELRVFAGTERLQVGRHRDVRVGVECARYQHKHAGEGSCEANSTVFSQHLVTHGFLVRTDTSGWKPDQPALASPLNLAITSPRE